MGENSKKLDFVFKKLSGQKDPTGSDPEDDDELELNLGLSLGGRFGVDKNKGLVRSSSIAAILPAVTSEKSGSGHGFGSGYGVGSGLARTASLPVETEEEWRKRKELQSLRRLAAKRRRSEKQKSLSKVEREEYVAAMGRVGSSVGPGFGSGNWDFGGGGEKSDNGSVPGSVESQASTVSEFESRGVRGLVNTIVLRFRSDDLVIHWSKRHPD
uniref:Ninja-family protein n=1 Tax=Tanacetum cinerariifolium TaxID=118510 RepID=A0A699L4R8_TANCI|nr:ninja-family protein AFP1-like [Tanacetum cinerariifolium]